MKSLADQSRNFKSHKLCHAEEKEEKCWPFGEEEENEAW